MRSTNISLFILSTLAGCAVPVEDVDAGDESTGADTTGATAADEAMAQDESDDETADGGPADADDTGAGSDTDGGDDPDDGSGSEDETGQSGATDGGPKGCGDGKVDGDEVCDDGVNDGSYGGCAEDCSALAAYCGDANVDDGEVCDFGDNDGRYGGCNADCQALAPYCGDGEVELGLEACDDGNDAINDGCNPDCTTPGMMLWDQTWNAVGAAIPIGYDVTPAGIEFMPNGNAQLAVTETNGQQAIWNLHVDLVTGDVISADELVPASSASYIAVATTRQDDGTVIAARYVVGESEHSTIFYMGPDGSVTLTVDQPNEAPWQDVAADPESDTIGVIRIEDGEVFVREYVEAVATFEYSADAVSATVVDVGYSGSGLSMGVLFELFTSSLAVISWSDNGDPALGGYWSEPSALEHVNVRTLIGTSDGGQLAVGDYTETGGPVRSVVAKLSAGVKAPAAWSVWNADDGAESAIAQDVCETPDGNFIVVGSTFSEATGHRTRIRKLTSNGAVIWDQTLKDEVVDRDHVTCDDAGGAVIAGRLNGEAWYGRIAP